MRLPSGDQPPKSWIAAGFAVSSTRLGRSFARIDQQQLLTFVAAEVDAIDQPVIHRRAPQQRDLLVVEGELPVGAGGEIERPHLRQARTAQMKQRLSVTGECWRGGSADGDEGFRVVCHTRAYRATRGWKARTG